MITAVSYTHLDVYKRQHVLCGFNKDQRPEFRHDFLSCICAGRDYSIVRGCHVHSGGNWPGRSKLVSGSIPRIDVGMNLSLIHI